jgi:hypothetical protein
VFSWSAQTLDQDTSPKLAATKRPSKINFHNLALKDALELVEHGYGVAIHYADDVRDADITEPLSGEFHNGRIEDVLALLLPHFGLTYVVVDAKTIRIEPTRP